MDRSFQVRGNRGGNNFHGKRDFKNDTTKRNRDDGDAEKADPLKLLANLL